MNTKFDLSDHITKNREAISLYDGKIHYRPAKRVICKDGFSLSVQASEYTYCSPRENDGPWYKFEVGFPEDPNNGKIEMPESWSKYSDGGSTWGYVPEQLILEWIESHGGVA